MIVELNKENTEFKPVVLTLTVTTAEELVVVRKGFLDLSCGNTTDSEFDDLCTPVSEALQSL